MMFSVTHTICEGPKLDALGTFLNVYITTFRVEPWDTLEDSLAF